MTEHGKIEWNQNLQNPEDGVSTTLTLTCRPDGTIHMDTPESQGGFRGDYASAQEATQSLVSYFERGIEQAKQVA